MLFLRFLITFGQKNVYVRLHQKIYFVFLLLCESYFIISELFNKYLHVSNTACDQAIRNVTGNVEKPEEWPSSGSLAVSYKYFFCNAWLKYLLYKQIKLKFKKFWLKKRPTIFRKKGFQIYLRINLFWK